MAEAVYLLCALLLFRGWRANRTRLLFWSALCFAGLAVNNILLFLDIVIVPHIDLRLVRGSVALGSFALLIHGLIGESK